MTSFPQQTPKALEGIRVLDLSTGIAGPMAAMFLADFGAEVVKVEEPEGDRGRGRIGFAMWNRNKRSVVADSSTDAGRAVIRELIAGADICIHGGDERPLPAEAQPGPACAANPSLIYLSVPPFLGKTPWAGGLESPALLAAMTGVSRRQNSCDGGPVDPVIAHWAYVHAVWAATAAAAALIERQSSGCGQQVTVGGMHGTMITSTPTLLVTRGTVEAPVTSGSGGPSPLYTRYRCADGTWLFLAALTPKFQHLAIAALGVEDILDDERIMGDPERFLLPANQAWSRQRLVERFASRDRQEWLDLLKTAGVPVAPLLDRSGWLSSPEVEFVGMRATLEDPTWGTVSMPANPVGLSATPAVIDTPAPALGEHTGDIPQWEPRPALHGAPVNGTGPLAGVRILDLGAVLAGPYAGTLLAELGADVVKVEIPEGDSFRGRGMPYIRGQRGLGLDLRSPAGKDALYKLTGTADVVIDNYRAGVLSRLEADYDRLKEFNPGIISVSISAFGEGSPYANDPAFDALLQSRSGTFTAQGGNDEPVVISVPIMDGTSAALAALGTVVALFHRRNTGEGQAIQVTMVGAATIAQSEELIEAEGRPAPPIGGLDHRGQNAFDRYYRTSDDWIRIQALEATAVQRLQSGGLASEPLPTDDAGWTLALEAAFAALTREEALSILYGVGIPAAPARKLGEALEDPEYHRWQVMTEIDRAEHTPVVAPHRYARFSRTEREGILLPPGVGEHSREVLLEAGLSDEQISELVAAGTVREGRQFEHQNFAAYR